MFTLSQQELKTIRVIGQAAAGRLHVGEAALLLGRSERQVQRLKQKYQPDDPRWVQHGNCGKRKPWALSDSACTQVLALARGKYAGFNDSHLHQKLCEVEHLQLCRESLRRILRRARIASPQKRRPRQYRARRERRARLGMMVQTDASRHDWLQGRGPVLTLIGFIDDATGRILAAHFQLEPENAIGYLRGLRQMIATHGVPLSLYRDRHSIFQRNDTHWTVAEELAGEQSPTHLGRCLRELGIQAIAAHSPQAKGRVERSWRTLQDRLVSELRLAGAATLQQANAVLALFLADYNRRFAIPPREIENQFRSLSSAFDLSRCLSLRYDRVVEPDHVVNFQGESLQLPRLNSPRGYARSAVELSHQLDGVLRIYRGDTLLHSVARALPTHVQDSPTFNRAPHSAAKKPPRIYKLGGRMAMAATV